MTFRRFAAALAIAAALGAPHARATNLSTDVTDIWWPDAEPGWGIQLIQNAGIIFATMFVYDTQNQPIDGDVLSQVLGAGTLDRIAGQLGLPRGEAAAEVASALPEVVDRMTPQGSVPANGDALVARALEILERGRR